jgi:hypothetical protein
MAFGEIGLLPHEYYNLLPREFRSLVDGYNHKQYRLSSEKRYAAYISILPFTKDLTLQKFCSDIWPLPMDEKREQQQLIEPPVIDNELWQALKKQMNVKSDYEMILEKHKNLSNG